MRFLLVGWSLGWLVLCVNLARTQLFNQRGSRCCCRHFVHVANTYHQWTSSKRGNFGWCWWASSNQLKVLRAKTGCLVKDRFCLETEALTLAWVSGVHCGFQTAGPHNHMSQILKISHIYIYMYVCMYIRVTRVSHGFCFSGESWLIWNISSYSFFSRVLFLHGAQSRSDSVSYSH